MRKLFFTGLLGLLPLAVTLIIVTIILNILTAPFQGSIQTILAYYGQLNKPFLFLSGEQVLYLTSRIMAVALLLGLILGIGFLGRLVIGKGIINLGNSIIQRIPFVNKIYKMVEDSVHSVFGEKASSFSQVVLVPYPHEEVYSIGFVAKKQTPENHDDKVFVVLPGTPNPTAAFMISYKYEEIHFLDMKVEDAVKFVISCGIMSPAFQNDTPQK